MRSNRLFLVALGCLLLAAADAWPAPPDPVAYRPGPPALFAPLTSPTIGVGPPRVVTPPASYDLTLSGDLALGGYVFKEGYPFLHNDGGAAGRNTALGIDALISATIGVPVPETSGQLNSAFGQAALKFNTYGIGNSAHGAFALQYNYGGSYNSAIGARSLFFNEYGSNNSAIGADSLFRNSVGSYNTANGPRSLFNSSTGSYNTAIGVDALRGLELDLAAGGSRNVGIGAAAGLSLEAGDDNIYVGSDAAAATESGQIRIGVAGTHTDAFVAGVVANTITGSHAVYVDASGQLGQNGSSRRYKRDIRDMEDSTERLLELRPVTFRHEGLGAEAPLNYGLIAEEVAAVFPELVAFNGRGEPETVRYHLLSSMLLNELQRQQRLIRRQERRLAALEARE